MATKVIVSGNFFILQDSTTGEEKLREPRIKVKYKVSTSDVFTFYEIQEMRNGSDFPYENGVEEFANLVDKDGSAFTDVDTLKVFLDANLGGNAGAVITIDISGNVVFINELSDLPDPVGGVITLLDNLTYYFTTDIDLVGNRLVLGSDTTILGASSENCSITSTGLSAGVALITATQTNPIRHITIKDVDTALDFDGTGNTMA